MYRTNFLCSCAALFVALNLITTPVDGQQWQRTISINGSPATVHASGPTTDGGAIVAGYHHMDSLYFAKLDANGAIVHTWNAPYAFVENVAQDRNGGYYSLGGLNGDKVLYRFTDQGTVPMAVRFDASYENGWPSNGPPCSIHQGPALEAGRFDYVLTIGDGPKNSWIYRVNSHGEVVWFDDHDMTTGLYSIYQAKALSGALTAAAGSLTGGPVVVELHAADGTMEWMNQYAIPNTQESHSADVVEAADGSLVVIGGRAWAGNSQTLVLNVALDGLVNWARLLSCPGSAEIHSHRIIRWNSNVAILGDVFNYDNNFGWAYHPVIIELDSLGDLVQARALQSLGADPPPDWVNPRFRSELSVAVDGNAVWSGQFWDADTAASRPLITKVLDDDHWDCAWEQIVVFDSITTCTPEALLYHQLTEPIILPHDVELTPTTGTVTTTCVALSTGPSRTSVGSLVVVPSPNEGRFTLHFPSGVDLNGADIRITDPRGRLIKTSSTLLHNDQFQIDLGNTSDGLYHCGARLGTRNYSCAFMVIR